MKYRANHQQNQHNFELHKIYLDNLLELEKEQQNLIDKQLQTSKVNVRSNALSLNTTTTTNTSTNGSSIANTAMKHKQTVQINNNSQISGLNNLGNSCFFNAILQNLAQTPFLEELLRENSTTQERAYQIKHNDDYDSELTDYDDDESPQSNENQLKSDELLKDLKETSNELDLTNRDATDQRKQPHRSMRLNELNILLKEQSGASSASSFLGKQVADLLKNMNNSVSTVNPSVLFGSVCKKIPAFKGFHQQDSHELLRNLLDAIKTEELKRRQSALLETFRVSKQNSLDEKIKMKIKRYGRLASYTHIDKCFGGHLLSSIVCEECNTCIQRVEPYLDLSLSISVGLTASTEDLAGESNDYSRKKSTRSNSALKKNSKNLEKITEDSSKQPTSKHLSKKNQKKAAKNAKKSRKNALYLKENQTEEDQETAETRDQAQANLTDPATDSTSDLTQAVNKMSLNINEDVANNEEEDEETSNGDNEPEIQLIETVDDQLDQQEDDKTVNIDEMKFKLENSFKLEAMKTIKLVSNAQQMDIEAQNSNLSTLQSCLAKFTSNETLSDKIKCENCTKKHQKTNRTANNIYTKAIKQYLICELPAVLTIHLKRFQQHGYRLEKSNKHVQFPLVLDMSPYTSKMCININSDQRNQTEPVLYSLYGLVEHSGRLNSGHYTAYVKSNRSKQRSLSSIFLGNQRLCHLNMMLKKWNGLSIVDTNNNSLDNMINNDLNSHDLNGESEATTINGAESISCENEEWFYISDSHVTEVNVSKVLKAQAYILFYERIE